MTPGGIMTDSIDTPDVPPTVVNPDSIGDPNQTPVVYIGDAGEVLGIPDRMASIRTRVARWSAMANDPARSIENPSPMCLASAELAADVPALLADLDAAREALRRAEESIGAWTRAADRAEEECQRLQGLVEDARAERDRMRPVVEAARAWRDDHPGEFGCDLYAAVDTYETQTGANS